jgi:fatty acid desaturase
MSEYPYQPIPVAWIRPPVDREILRQCTERSDLLGLAHCLGTLAILGASGSFAYLMYATGHWALLALALYVHGGLFAFQPQTHEFAHHTVFKTQWLNRFFSRVFGLVHWWGSNSALYRMSHMHHHRYTVHRRSDGEVVLPAPETTEALLESAVRVVDPTRLIVALYDQVYALFTPFLRNPRRSVWQRYVYANSTPAEQRDAYWTGVSQLLFHAVFGALAVATGHGFLIVVVSLPAFYGGKWYAVLVHDTMHSGRQPEVDDFRLCCRSVRVDPLTSFLYWHMEYHTEHHAFAGVPCYRLKTFHKLTREHWDPPQSLAEAWREMNRHAEGVLAIPPPRLPRG